MMIEAVWVMELLEVAGMFGLVGFATAVVELVAEFGFAVVGFEVVALDEVVELRDELLVRGC